jgi:hypothetical protein
MTGTVARIVRWLDERHGAFMVARLIMKTGIKVRDYGDQSPDEKEVLRRLEAALASLLSSEDYQTATRLLRH